MCSLSLGVRRGAGLTHVLSIKGRIGRPPVGAKLELVWHVKRGGRVVARHVLALTGK